MGKGEGITRLSTGFERSLSTSEIERGYLFITIDKRVGELLDSKGFEVILNGKSAGIKKLDSCGRIYLGYDLVKLAISTTVAVKTVKGKLIINAR